MAINKEEVEKLATLARLELKPGEAKALALDIESILGYISEIQNVVTEEPELSSGANYNVVREDKEPHTPGEYTEAILSEAPSREGDHISVKRIIQND